MTTDLPIKPDGLAQVQAMLATGRQRPLGEKLRISLVEVEYGHAVFEAIPDGTSYNPMGTVHSGYISAILDSACGIAAHTGLKPGFGLYHAGVEGVVPACPERVQRKDPGGRMSSVDGWSRGVFGGHAHQREGAAVRHGDFDTARL